MPKNFARILLLCTLVHASHAQIHREILGPELNFNLYPRAMGDDGSSAVLTGIVFNTSTPFRWSESAGLQELDLLPGYFGGSVSGASSDGRLTSGTLQGPVSLPVVWSENSAPMALDVVNPGEITRTTGISRDGTTVIGDRWVSPTSPRAVRWVGLGNLEGLGSLGGIESQAFAVSADGEVVVGLAENATGVMRVFRWTEAGGMVDIGPTGFGPIARVAAMSADGNAVLICTLGSGPDPIFLWRPTTGPVQIGSFQEGEDWYFTGRISADGSAVTWLEPSMTQPGLQCSYWSSTLGTVDLTGIILGLNLSEDGQIVSGIMGTSSAGQAALWSPSVGLTVLDSPPGDITSAYLISPDGQVVIGFRGNGTLARWRADRQVGELYCNDAQPNSTGSAGALVAVGTNELNFGGLELRAESLPPFAFGFFLASRSQASVFPVTGSQGRLCLGGAIGRFVGPGQVQNSGASGAFSLAVDKGALPTPNGPVPGAPGESWNFQGWFRDANPGVTSNFTSAVRVTLW